MSQLKEKVIFEHIHLLAFQMCIFADFFILWNSKMNVFGFWATQTYCICFVVLYVSMFYFLFGCSSLELKVWFD